MVSASLNGRMIHSLKTRFTVDRDFFFIISHLVENV